MNDLAPFARNAIVPFATEHVLEMLVQESQKLQWHDRRALAAQYAAAGNAFTLMSAAGRPLFCGGAIEMHPRSDGETVDGHAQLWALFATDKGHAMTRILRATRQFIDSLQYGRIDTPVLDNGAAIRWARMLGLKFDVRLRGAAPKGADMLIYRRAF